MSSQRNVYDLPKLLFEYQTGALDSKFSDESDELADEGISGPERAYRGPHLVFPLQKKDIDTLIELFRKKKVWNTYGINKI